MLIFHKPTRYQINCKDRFGNTPLKDALRSNHPEIVEYLRRQGGTLGMSREDLAAGSRTLIYLIPSALCHAASTGNYQEVKKLIINGADPNSGDYDRRTALHLAASEVRKTRWWILNSYRDILTSSNS